MVENGEWVEKDIIYAVGCVEEKCLKSLALVYGSVYCADKEYYEKIFTLIKQSIHNSDLPFEKTNELAHINAVDPLGITYFRARGMWGIAHPFKVYDYIYTYNRKSVFSLMVIIPTDIFKTFDNSRELIELSNRIDSFSIEDKKVKNPNNTAELIDVKLITYEI